MRNVLGAIQKKFDADVALTARFDGGCYFSLAPSGKALPVCVVNVASAVPDYSTEDNAKPVAVQFNVYYDANDDPDSGKHCLDAIEDLKTCFDFADLDLEGDGELTEVRRMNEGAFKDDEGSWHGFVEYEITVTEGN